MNELPIGCIFCYPSPICPDGFLPCDGRELSKTVYSELYNLIRDTWGETSTSFFLPDLRGQFVRGWDDGVGIDPDSGADDVRKFGSEQLDTFQGHDHDLSTNGELSESILYYQEKTIAYGSNTFSENKSISFNSIIAQSEHLTDVFKRIGGILVNVALTNRTHLATLAMKHRHKLPEIKVKGAISSTFQKVRASVETRPKNVALMYCIKVK